jgi:hypothetical protein
MGLRLLVRREQARHTGHVCQPLRRRASARGARVRGAGAHASHAHQRSQMRLKLLLRSAASVASREDLPNSQLLLRLRPQNVVVGQPESRKNESRSAVRTQQFGPEFALCDIMEDVTGTVQRDDVIDVVCGESGNRLPDVVLGIRRQVKSADDGVDFLDSRRGASAGDGTVCANTDRATLALSGGATVRGISTNGV